MGEQGFAGAGRTNQENIGLAELDFTGLLVEEDALVMVVDGDREFLLRAILADDVAIKELLDFGRAGEATGRCSGLFAFFVFQNGLADAHALVANVRARIVRRRTDQLFDLFLSFVAEGTAKRFIWAIFFHV